MIAARFLRRIRDDRRGVTVVEFAIVAPTLLLLMVGGLDTAHSLYMRAILQGVIQKTARDSAIEGNSAAAQRAIIDDRVRRSVLAIANNAQIDITRRYYRTFAKAAAAQFEQYNDTNNDGTCNNNEAYQDSNNNQVWDKDGGDDGQGTAKDRTVYTVVVGYPRFFPLWKFLGGSDRTRITATTVLENQPYGDQQSYAATTVRNCP